MWGSSPCCLGSPLLLPNALHSPPACFYVRQFPCQSPIRYVISHFFSPVPFLRKAKLRSSISIVLYGGGTSRAQNLALSVSKSSFPLLFYVVKNVTSVYLLFFHYALTALSHSRRSVISPILSFPPIAQLNRVPCEGLLFPACGPPFFPALPELLRHLGYPSCSSLFFLGWHPTACELAFAAHE